MFGLSRQKASRDRHLTDAEVFEFAEALSRRGASVSVAWAAHVASCPRCARKVKAARTTLKITELSREIDPPADLADRIIRAARERMPRVDRRAERRVMPLLGRLAVSTLAAACAVLLLFPAALRLAEVPSVAAQDPDSALMAVDPARHTNEPAGGFVGGEMERLRRSMDRATLLVEAMRRHAPEGPNWREREQARLVNLASDELATARLLMERAAGNPRAAARLAEQLERRAEHLKRLYIGQAL
ncbi:MAG TPA: hypothetical protein PK349_08100 [Candidatus Hydrogenedentes bacterium]|nr:hypothetical protein [Candidatus Hydrogenedentota bacterium]